MTPPNRPIMIGILIATAGLVCCGFIAGYMYANISGGVQQTYSDKDIITNPSVANTVATPEPQSPYVMCSDYSQVTDKYKTVKGNFVVVQNETEFVDDIIYSNITLPGYVKADVSTWGGYVTYDEGYSRFHLSYEISDPIKTLTPVTEEESGYRDACVVTR